MRRTAASLPVPTTVFVIDTRVIESFAMRATPKSMTFTTPSDVTIMFDGFRSRWMTSRECA